MVLFMELQIPSNLSDSMLPASGYYTMEPGGEVVKIASSQRVADIHYLMEI